MKKTLFIIYLALLAALLASCVTREDVNRVGLALKKIQITDMTDSGFNATLYMQVDNPNWFGIRVAEMDYHLLVGGSEAAGGSIGHEIDVPGRGSVVAELPVSVRLDGLDGFLDRALSGGLEYRVKGHMVIKAFLGSYTVDFDREIKKKNRPPLPTSTSPM